MAIQNFILFPLTQEMGCHIQFHHVCVSVCVRAQGLGNVQRPTLEYIQDEIFKKDTQKAVYINGICCGYFFFYISQEPVIKDIDTSERSYGGTHGQLLCGCVHVLFYQNNQN